jgi:hypothetical protein
MRSGLGGRVLAVPALTRQARSGWAGKAMFRDWCSRSIFPVVVGDAGRVSRWVMPFSRQIRSNSASAGRGLMNRPVKTVPLSDKTSSGTLLMLMASRNAWQTGRAVARITALATTRPGVPSVCSPAACACGTSARSGRCGPAPGRP